MKPNGSGRPNLEDRLPPHNIEAERAVLGTLLYDHVVAWPICEEKFGRSDPFYDLRNRALYGLIHAMTRAYLPVNAATVYAEANRRGIESQIGCAGNLVVIANLVQDCASPHGVAYWCDILVELAQQRRLIAIGAETAAAARDGVEIEELVPQTIRTLSDLAAAAQPKQDHSIKTLVQSALSRIEALHARQGRIDGLCTGFPDLDKLTGGFQPGDMIVIAARPSTGKTSLAMNIAEHVAVDQKRGVLVFSLEMTAESLVLRMLCSRARINLRNVRDGFLAERDLPKIALAASQLSVAPIWIDDTPALNVHELHMRAERAVQEHDIAIVIVDYLQLCRGALRKADNRQTEVSDISATLKAAAKSCRVPVIALSQLNRELDKRAGRPRLSDLRESGSIEQDADFVGLLYHPDRGQDADDDCSDARAINLLVAKQRNGPTGDVPLMFLKAYTRFESAAKVEHEDVPKQREVSQPYPD